MDEARKPTILVGVWLIAYVTIGGAVFLVSTQLIERAAMDGLWAIVVATAVTAVIGWLAASWVQRRIAARLGTPARPLLPPVA